MSKKPEVATSLGGGWRWLLGLGALALIYGGSSVDHMERAADPLSMNDDARALIFPFYRFTDPTLFPRDYIGDYYLAIYPWFYRLLYTAVSTVWDPASFSRVLPYPLLLLVVGAVGVVAHRLGGRTAAFCAMAICLGSSYYLERMGGGLPRAFGFPLIVCPLAALVIGRIYPTAVLVCLGAAFYPVAGVLAGLALAGVLLLLPAGDRGEAKAWSLRKRIVVLAATAVVSGLLLLPMVLASRDYGPRLSAADHDRYPEAGPKGRALPMNVAPWPSFVELAPKYVRLGLVGNGAPLSPLHGRLTAGLGRRSGWSQELLWGGLLLIVILGWTPLCLRSPPARVVTVLAAASVVGYELASLASPYLHLPPRYVMYSVPPLICIVVPASLVSLGLTIARRLERPRWGPPAAAVMCLALVLAVSTRVDPTAGLNRSAADSAEVLRAIAALPETALVAGWPRGVMDYVPYVCRRQALITFETHMVFHQGYADEMRRRMHALIEAYFATSVDPVRRLRDQLGVTHLLVDTRHYSEQPRYFAPFQSRVRTAAEHAGDRAFLASDAAGEAIVFRNDSVLLLDLSRL